MPSQGPRLPSGIHDFKCASCPAMFMSRATAPHIYDYVVLCNIAYLCWVVTCWGAPNLGGTEGTGDQHVPWSICQAADTLGGFCQRLPRLVYQSHAFDLGGIDLGSDFQAHTEGLFQLVFKEAAILLGLDQLLLKAMLWGKT
jgi:hypothetical protein